LMVALGLLEKPLGQLLTFIRIAMPTAFFVQIPKQTFETHDFF